MSSWFVNTQQVWQPIFEDTALARPPPAEVEPSTRTDTLRARMNYAIEHQQLELSMPGDEESGDVAAFRRGSIRSVCDADYDPADTSGGSSD